MDDTTISIVMSTYNGAKYIEKQLDSIYQQSRPADEVIIVDDCSNDDTFMIVEKYIKNRNLYNWRVSKNPVNYGWKKSFSEALQHAKGTYIFPADQDDIWKLNKLEVMTGEMKRLPDCLLLASDIQKIYFDDEPDANSWLMGSYSIKKIPFDLRWYYIRRPGCVFCCKREIVQLIPELWYADYAHDVLLWHLAIINDGLYTINAPSIFFRRHDSNATPPNLHTKSVRLKNASIAFEETQHIISALEQNKMLTEIREKKKHIIYGYGEFGRHRCSFLSTRNIRDFLWLYKHRRYYWGIKSWVQDLICTFK